MIYFLNGIVLYPNPFSNKITINTSEQTEEIATIEIFNTLGALIHKVSIDSRSTTIDTSNLARGIYVIKLNAFSGKSIIKKMVKK